MRKGLALGASLIAVNAVAQENALYVGAGGGGTNFDSDTYEVSTPSGTPATVPAVIEDSDGNIRLYAGYRWTPNLAFEAAYSDLGEFELLDDANGFDVTQDIQSFDVAAVGLLPLWDGRVDLFARAGLAFWSGDADVTAQDGVTGTPGFVSRPEDSGQDLFWSVGFNINAFADRRWTFRSELTTYELSDADKLETLGFSIQYRF